MVRRFHDPRSCTAFHGQAFAHAAAAGFRGIRRITHGSRWWPRRKLTQKVTKRRIARVDAENPLGDTSQFMKTG
jgi:hypothetical protein